MIWPEVIWFDLSDHYSIVFLQSFSSSPLSLELFWFVQQSCNFFWGSLRTLTFSCISSQHMHFSRFLPGKSTQGTLHMFFTTSPKRQSSFLIGLCRPCSMSIASLVDSPDRNAHSGGQCFFVWNSKVSCEVVVFVTEHNLPQLMETIAFFRFWKQRNATVSITFNGLRDAHVLFFLLPSFLWATSEVMGVNYGATQCKLSQIVCISTNMVILIDCSLVYMAARY